MLVRDPLYGDISFNENEYKLISTQSFDRLRRIKQLSFSEYVYPSATHNRFAHSLGVAEVVGRMFDVIQSKVRVFKQEDRELIRMIALCHDIGHSPFSHSSEVLSSIEHEERMVDILRLEKNNIVLEHKYDIEAHDLISQVYNGDGSFYISNPKYSLLRSFMDNFIDADKMDYLCRDAMYCGIKYGEYDRESLINSLTLVDNKGVLSVGIDYSGLQALEGFILARYYMFSQVYFHPLRRLYDTLFVEYMQRLLPGGRYPVEVKKFLQWDDTRVSSKILKSREFGYNYKLVYDADFNLHNKMIIDSKLDGFVLCDTPRKSIFKTQGDSELYIVDNLMGYAVPVTSVSPLLKSIEYSSIHKLRYYAQESIADDIHDEIINLLR